MKKVLFLIPLAALAMVSCSSDSAEQAAQVSNQEVKLFPQVTGATRGTVETTSSISNFQLIATGKFATTATATAATVTNTGIKYAIKSGSTWSLFGEAAGTTDYKLYWFDATTTGKFTAYANSGTVAASDGKLTGVTVAADVDDQADLVVAYNEGTKADFAAGVPLHFRHAMSQIVVKASYTYDASLTGYETKTIKVKGIKFFNLKNSGTLTLPTASTAAGETYEPAWSGHTGSTAYEVTLNTPVTLGSTATAIDLSEAANPLLLLPQTTAAETQLVKDAPSTTTFTGAYLAVQVNIDNADSSDYYPVANAGANAYAWVAVPVSIEWKGGNKYIYTLNFTNGAMGRIAPGTVDAGDGQVTPDGKKVGDALPDELLTPVTFLVTVEDEWTENNLTPTF